MEPSERQYTQEEIEELRKAPVRCDNCHKTAKEVGKKLSVCAACSSAPYCSVECQRQHWKTHKVYCKKVMSGELMREAMSLPAGNIGGTRQGNRLTGEVLRDLTVWAEVYNGDCLTVVAWHALGLLRDIEARKSKILLLGLRRTPSNDPKTYYTLKDVCVVPVVDAKRIFKNLSPNPIRILRDAETERQKDGAIGAMLVISLEQAVDDNRPAVEVLGKTSSTIFQPLGVFEIHRTTFQSIGQFPEPVWKTCLNNCLRGGAFSLKFRPA
ncbi:Ankyrin [Mycena sanguinolenta]|uniref:Ankyrin n=1 Tax=Mycena sanguinolenta TaxID=230812 RepID=A0A8H7D2F7_9AGAR|nr:Ankyrin [Mycena sanguinolenta]